MIWTLRRMLTPYGWTYPTVLALGFTILASVTSAVASVGFWVSRRMDTDDHTWSFAAGGALLTALLLALALVDRLPGMRTTASRGVLLQRAWNMTAAAVVALWPLALVLLGARAQWCLGAWAQSFPCLGLGAWLGRLRREFAVIPAAVVLALAMLPNTLPLAVHPLVPARHPAALVSGQVALGVFLAASWVLLDVPRWLEK